MRPLRFIRYCAPALILLYLCLPLFLPQAQISKQLIFYNLIPLGAVSAIIAAPFKVHLLSAISLASAITIWSSASILSSYDQFVAPLENALKYANFAYLLFYPLLFISLAKIAESKSKLEVAQLLDLLIFSLLLLSWLFSLFLAQIGKNPEEFSGFEIQLTLYLLADVLMLIWVIRTLLLCHISKRIIFLISGAVLFAISDLIYIWSALKSTYSVGDLTDLGWVVAFALMAAALWEDDLGSAHKKTLPTISLASALLLLPALLVYQTISFQSIYPLLIIPTLLALMLLILRVSILLRVSRQLSSESHLAITDELTGLANRRRLVAELSTLADNEGAFLLLDLDGFKPINDQYGHLVGDQLLQEVAERFKRALPSDALIGRLGGDEFGVIIRGNYEETLEGAYALRASLSYPFTLSGQKISVGVSIGHIQNDGGGELLKRADLAMYEAKRSELGVVQS